MNLWFRVENLRLHGEKKEQLVRETSWPFSELCLGFSIGVSRV